MRFKVELHPDVRFFLRKASRETRMAFEEALRLVCDDPIENSIAHHDPKQSKYMLRYFRFDGHLAIFGLIASRDEIRVIECRPPKHIANRQSRTDAEP